MANLTETDDWASGIYQIEEDDPVLGGPTGLTNTPPRQLANRTLYQRLRNVTPWDAALLYPAQAYVQHAGKTYRSAAININVAPGSDATKWERWGFTLAELNAELTTPAQFDSTTKAATTAFLAAAGLQFSGKTRAYSSGVQLVLAVADVGASIEFNGAVAQSAKLPPTPTLPVGATVRLVSGNAAASVTVSSDDGTAKIDTMGGLVSSLALQKGEDIIATWTGGAWMCSGSYVFRVQQFGAARTTNGYQKLPGGLILQWINSATTSSTNGQDTTFSWPISFPTACLIVQANFTEGSNPYTDVTLPLFVTGRSTTAVTLRSYAGAGNGCDIFAIGY